ncbi:hypothetical protein J6590_023004 [Homalodisca vitripennis]|nr:hypothetical protein J6590_023004 [Homalodisca vitripennis]
MKCDSIEKNHGCKVQLDHAYQSTDRVVEFPGNVGEHGENEIGHHPSRITRFATDLFDYCGSSIHCSKISKCLSSPKRGRPERGVSEKEHP